MFVCAFLSACLSIFLCIGTEADEALRASDDCDGQPKSRSFDNQHKSVARATARQSRIFAGLAIAMARQEPHMRRSEKTRTCYRRGELQLRSSEE
jgi:hypothetical protein